VKGSTKCPCGCGGDISNELKDKIAFIEAMLKFELTATSGFRCPAYNVKVGGVANSSHTKGLAIDVIVSNSRNRYLLIKALNNVNINRFGISFKGNFIHFDIDSSLDQEVCWGY
jgi:uncharacterized protein YcbK (DUF882 family)